MARSFADEVNELKINDNLSNSTIILYYRDPTTEERVGYANESVVRKRNMVVTRITETRLKYGGLILTGFREGDFVTKKDGQIIPMSANPNSPNFCPDWKDQVTRKASDLLMLLGAQVFDASASIDPGGTGSEEGAEKN